LRLKLYRGSWYAVWREGGETKRLALRTHDRAVAERRLIDKQRQPSGETVADFAKAYLKAKETARSYESMRFCWANLESHFGHLRPDQITPDVCKQYAKKRKVKPGTIIKDLGFLRTALKGKAAQFWLPPTPPPRDIYLTRGEFHNLLKAASLPHLKLFLVLALTTGGRTGALLDLTWDRVDFRKGQIRLSNGLVGGKGRATVPMNQAAREALEEAQKGRESEWVIEWAGRQVGSIKRGFREAVTRAKLRKEITPHVLRHTAAVWMIEDGASITEVAQYLGHSDTRTTYRVYARHSPEHLQKAAAALDWRRE
jgi:integrase